jgi:hypothetical protein
MAPLRLAVQPADATSVISMALYGIEVTFVVPGQAVGGLGHVRDDTGANLALDPLSFPVLRFR